MKPLIVSFSFGKTSAFMAHWLKENFSHEYELTFLFANTGREHEKTLEFGHKCDQYFGLNVIWLEAVINPTKGIGPRHKVVDFHTAARGGEPFADAIAKEGIPNTSRAWCTDRLKTQVMRSWMRENGHLRRGYCTPTAIGMRADEPKRCNPNAPVVSRYNLVYPLAHWGAFDKQDINTFWEDMPFTLEIPEHYGNCLTCFKKSDKKLFRVAHEHPEWFAWNSEMENKYGGINAIPGKTNVFYRRQRNASHIVGEALEIDPSRVIYMTESDVDNSGGCGESCEPFSNIQDREVE